MIFMDLLTHFVYILICLFYLFTDFVIGFLVLLDLNRFGFQLLLVFENAGEESVVGLRVVGVDHLIRFNYFCCKGFGEMSIILGQFQQIVTNKLERHNELILLFY